MKIIINRSGHTGIAVSLFFDPKKPRISKFEDHQWALGKIKVGKSDFKLRDFFVAFSESNDSQILQDPEEFTVGKMSNKNVWFSFWIQKLLFSTLVTQQCHEIWKALSDGCIT